MAGRVSRVRAAGAALMLAAVPMLLVTSPTLAAGTDIVVNDLGDVAADDGLCTLREAIVAANTDAASGASAGECSAGSAAPDSISFSMSGTIAITTDLPAITADLAIDGDDAIKIDGQQKSRPITIAAGAVTLSHLTLTRGFGVQGGAVHNDGQLTVDATVIAHSASDDAGGAIDNFGTALVTHSRLSDNTAVQAGGAIGTAEGATLTIDQSTLNRNHAGFGGAILGRGTVVITQSLLSDNSADDAGAIDNSGTMTIANTTISGNTAGGIGGGVLNVKASPIDHSGLPILDIVNSTIFGNTAGSDAGGLYAGDHATVVNTIVLGNSAPSFADVEGALATDTANLVVLPSGRTLSQVIQPGGLRDNGGSTNTLALTPIAINPAIDHGDAAACAAAPVSGVDQRGHAREATACDVGAFEAAKPLPTQSNTSATPLVRSGNTPGASALALLLLLAGLVLVGATLVPAPRSRR